MKTSPKPALAALLSAVALAMPCIASATLLTSYISMDNEFKVYVSTDNTTAGTEFGSGTRWQDVVGFTTTLTAGQDYYLHVFGHNRTEGAAFLGQFSLAGTDHRFANGLTTLLTNTTDWQGNNTGFAAAYNVALSLKGGNGDGPWGTREPIANAASWIWAGPISDGADAWFSARILASEADPTAVPEPGTLGLASLALLAVAGLRPRGAARGR